MRRFAYISTAVPMSDSDVDAIVDKAADSNAARGLTGFLFFNGRNFLQLLEGPEAELRKMISGLARDPRHSGIRKLLDEPARMRVCPNWTMRRLHFGEDVQDRRDAILAQLPPELPEALREVVENFASLN